MNYSYVLGIAMVLLATFITSISQILLKKSAQKKYDNKISEYLNQLVICGYMLLLFTTLISVFALRYIPVSLFIALESMAQIFVPVLSFLILKEQINKRKLLGMFVILVGLLVYFL